MLHSVRRLLLDPKTPTIRRKRKDKVGNCLLLQCKYVCCILRVASCWTQSHQKCKEAGRKQQGGCLLLQWLMTDANSPIHDFYPTDFKVDMEGKRNDWEGVVLIPFIDEARLLEASRTVGPAKLSRVCGLLFLYFYSYTSVLMLLFLYLTLVLPV